jgi:hypothetical protein
MLALALVGLLAGSILYVVGSVGVAIRDWRRERRWKRRWNTYLETGVWREDHP